MWRVEQVLQGIVGVLSRLLDPVVAVLVRGDALAVEQVGRLGVSPLSAERLVAAVWLVAVLLLLRALQGWWRVAALVAILVVLGRIYGIIPRSGS